MSRKKAVVIVLVLGCALAVAAQTPDFLKAGGWELGGSCMYVYRPLYPVFETDLTDAEKSSYYSTLDAGIKAGIFLADRFSLSLNGTAFWMRTKEGASDTEYRRDTLILGLGLEPTFYLMLGSSFALGLGAEAGVGVVPGIDRISSGSTVNNDSLDMAFNLEPKLGAYFFLSGGLAAYASAGYKFYYLREIKDSAGDSVTYASDYSIMQNVNGRLNCTIGLAYFLPAGSRFVEKHKTSYDDIMDVEGGPK